LFIVFLVLFVVSLITGRRTKLSVSAERAHDGKIETTIPIKRTCAVSWKFGAMRKPGVTSALELR